MRYRFLHLSLLLTMVLLGSVVTTSALAKSRKKQQRTTVVGRRDTLSYEDSRRYAYFFLEASRQQNAGNFSGAFDLINHCLDINPNAAEAYYMRSKYYTTLHLDTLGLRDLETAARLQPSNSTYQESVAQTLHRYRQLRQGHRCL